MRHDLMCAMNGVLLHTLDDRIYLEEIREEPSLSAETLTRPFGGLLLAAPPARDSLSIRLTVYVKERRSIEDRMRVIDKVLGWATAGWFTASHRPGKRIRVHCTKAPTADAYDRTGRLEITFTAYGEASWQETVPLTVSVEEAASSGETALTPRGTRPCYLEAEITPDGGTLTEAVITAGAGTIALSGLNVADGETLSLSYDEAGFLRIEHGGVSVADKRTGASSDHLILTPGVANTVAVSFDTPCAYTLTARGLWR